MDTITCTRAQLRQVYAEWENDMRAGKCMSNDEAAALPVDEVASQNADKVWRDLMKVGARENQ